MLSCSCEGTGVHMMDRMAPSIHPFDPVHCDMSTEVVEIEREEKDEVLPAEFEDSWRQFREFSVGDPDDLDDSHRVDP